LETVFLASIQREEEKPIMVSTTLLPRDFSDEANRYSGRKLIVHFSEAIPFNVQSIKKVAPAFDAVVSSLLVAPKNLPHDYEIWGAMFFRPPINSFDDIAVGTGYEFFRADALTVTAVSPGSLIISRGDSVIGRFLSGKFEKAVPTPFIQEAMGKYILNLLGSYGGGLNLKRSGRAFNYYMDTVMYLLSECSNRGHGGTVILISSVRVNEYSKYITSKYAFNRKFGLEEPLKKILEEQMKYEEFVKDHIKHIKDHERGAQENGISTAELIKLAINRRYMERIDLLAQFSCIDGALIITDWLNLVSFGSTLKAPKWYGKILAGPDGFGGGGENINASKFGSRHNSTIDFVGACPESLGFVISQDGPIRALVRRDGDTILYWSDCFISMSLEEAIKSKN
jgi:hypothetical protein